LVAICAALASAATWNIIKPDFATISFAVSCTDDKNCIAPVGVNGQGAFIWVTNDGWKTYTPAGEDEAAMMYLGAAMKDTFGVVSEPLALYNSDSPDKWNFSLAAVQPSGSWTSQNVEQFGDTYFGATGNDPDGGNGVAISDSDGELFTVYATDEWKTVPRYGAFPSLTTWYLSGGEWPRRQLNSDVVYEFSSRLHARSTNGESSVGFTSDEAPYVADRDTPNSGWKAQIVKTTDGGSTWSTVFYDEDKFYFNQIGCGSESHCCAAGEANNSTESGIRIVCTTDGGANWKRTLWVPNPAFSIMALRFLSDTEVWAAGGDMGDDFTGYFWHSTDGGNSWDDSAQVPGIFGNCLTFPSKTHAFATAVTIDQQGALLEFA